MTFVTSRDDIAYYRHMAKNPMIYLSTKEGNDGHDKSIRNRTS